MNATSALDKYVNSAPRNVGYYDLRQPDFDNPVIEGTLFLDDLEDVSLRQ